MGCKDAACVFSMLGVLLYSFGTSAFLARLSPIYAVHHSEIRTDANVHASWFTARKDERPECLAAFSRHDVKDRLSSPHNILAPCRREFMGRVYVLDRELDAAGVVFRPAKGVTHSQHEGIGGDKWVSWYNADQYSAGMLLQDDLGFLTRNISEARVFLVPSFGTYEVNACFIATKQFADCTLHVDANYLYPIMKAITELPSWKASNGSDHIIIMTQDAGLKCELYPRTCALLAGRGIVWAPVLPRPGSADVVIPPVSSESWDASTGYRTVLRQPGSAAHVGAYGAQPCTPYDPDKMHLGVFRGSIDDRGCGFRKSMQHTYRRDGPLGGVGITVGPSKAADYIPEIDNSLFCMSLPGHTTWTARQYDFIAHGCPPVLFDNVPNACSAYPIDTDTPRPFASFLDWDSFSLSVDGSRMNETHEVLRRNIGRACNMRKRLAEAHPYLLWKQNPTLVLTMALSETLAIVQNASLPRAAVAAAARSGVTVSLR